MAKKQKRAIPKPAPTKRQLSKWQRQMRIRRIIVIAASVFLAGIMGLVGYGYYKDKIEPLREVVFTVNDASLTMGYYVKMLDVYTKGMDPYLIYYMADMVATEIIQAEVLAQGAKRVGIEVTPAEVDARLKEYELPDGEAYRDMISADLFREKLREYFDAELPDIMEQAHVQVMLVESQEVADEVITKIEASGNFTALVDEFSHHPEIEGDLGWLPRELMPNPLIEEAAFSVAPGELSQPIYEDSASKNLGYWLIEVIDTKDDEIKARAMLLGSKVEAEEVRARLASEDFSSLAEEYSKHVSKFDGGELGWLKQGDMGSEAFDEVAFNLDLNTISEPVKDESFPTAGGYWIVRVVDRGEHELEKEVRERLTDRHLSDWLAGQKENSTIENRLDEEKKSWAVDRVLRGR